VCDVLKCSGASTVLHVYRFSFGGHEQGRVSHW
jgi:hypothetical protein